MRRGRGERDKNAGELSTLPASTSTALERGVGRGTVEDPVSLVDTDESETESTRGKRLQNCINVQTEMDMDKCLKDAGFKPEKLTKKEKETIAESDRGKRLHNRINAQKEMDMDKCLKDAGFMPEELTKQEKETIAKALKSSVESVTKENNLRTLQRAQQHQEEDKKKQTQAGSSRLAGHQEKEAACKDGEQAGRPSPQQACGNERQTGGDRLQDGEEHGSTGHISSGVMIKAQDSDLVTLSSEDNMQIKLINSKCDENQTLAAQRSPVTRETRATGSLKHSGVLRGRGRGKQGRGTKTIRNMILKDSSGEEEDAEHVGPMEKRDVLRNRSPGRGTATSVEKDRRNKQDGSPLKIVRLSPRGSPCSSKNQQRRLFKDQVNDRKDLKEEVSDKHGAGDSESSELLDRKRNPSDAVDADGEGATRPKRAKEDPTSKAKKMSPTKSKHVDDCEDQSQPLQGHSSQGQASTDLGSQGGSAEGRSVKDVHVSSGVEGSMTSDVDIFDCSQLPQREEDEDNEPCLDDTENIPPKSAAQNSQEKLDITVRAKHGEQAVGQVNEDIQQRQPFDVYYETKLARDQMCINLMDVDETVDRQEVKEAEEEGCQFCPPNPKFTAAQLINKNKRRLELYDPNPYFSTSSVELLAASEAILQHLLQWRSALRILQATSSRKIPYGDPVIVGSHRPQTLFTRVCGRMAMRHHADLMMREEIGGEFTELGEDEQLREQPSRSQRAMRKRDWQPDSDEDSDFEIGPKKKGKSKQTRLTTSTKSGTLQVKRTRHQEERGAAEEDVLFSNAPHIQRKFTASRGRNAGAQGLSGVVNEGSNDSIPLPSAQPVRASQASVSSSSSSPLTILMTEQQTVSPTIDLNSERSRSPSLFEEKVSSQETPQNGDLPIQLSQNSVSSSQPKSSAQGELEPAEPVAENKRVKKGRKTPSPRKSKETRTEAAITPTSTEIKMEGEQCTTTRGREKNIEEESQESLKTKRGASKKETNSSDKANEESDMKSVSPKSPQKRSWSKQPANASSSSEDSSVGTVVVDTEDTNGENSQSVLTRKTRSSRKKNNKQSIVGNSNVTPPLQVLKLPLTTPGQQRSSQGHSVAAETVTKVTSRVDNDLDSTDDESDFMALRSKRGTEAMVVVKEEEDEEGEDTVQTDKVECPLCGRRFPPSVILEHAADCQGLTPKKPEMRPRRGITSALPPDEEDMEEVSGRSLLKEVKPRPGRAIAEVASHRDRGRSPQKHTRLSRPVLAQTQMRTTRQDEDVDTEHGTEERDTPWLTTPKKEKEPESTEPCLICGQHQPKSTLHVHINECLNAQESQQMEEKEEEEEEEQPIKEPIPGHRGQKPLLTLARRALRERGNQPAREGRVLARNFSGRKTEASGRATTAAAGGAGIMGLDPSVRKTRETRAQNTAASTQRESLSAVNQDCVIEVEDSDEELEVKEKEKVPEVKVMIRKVPLGQQQQQMQAHRGPLSGRRADAEDCPDQLNSRGAVILSTSSSDVSCSDSEVSSSDVDDHRPLSSALLARTSTATTSTARVHRTQDDNDDVPSSPVRTFQRISEIQGEVDIDFHNQFRKAPAGGTTRRGTKRKQKGAHRGRKQKRRRKKASKKGSRKSSSPKWLKKEVD